MYFFFTSSLSRSRVHSALIFLVLLFFAGAAFAQTAGTLKGTVKTSDGKPAEFVNIQIKETDQGTSVTQSGHYTIHNIKPGTYTIVASFISLNTQSKQA